MDALPPINLIKLRDIIGDDPETEQLLLSTFIKSTEESLTLLSNQFPASEQPKYSQLWKGHMHQIKGSALNIGAEYLASLTSEMQDAYDSPLPEMKKMLGEINAELARIKKFIETQN
jgi:HPt (histidine-containing phosphotransfer) domain-containing protein